MRVLSILLLILSSVVIWPLHASATDTITPPEPTAQCASMLSSCFALGAIEQGKCFFSAAHHPFCAGTTLGKISEKRAFMGQTLPGGTGTEPGFLGPQLVNTKCLENFDNRFSSVILQKEISLQDLADLREWLDSCSQDIDLPGEMMRP